MVSAEPLADFGGSLVLHPSVPYANTQDQEMRVLPHLLSSTWRVTDAEVTVSREHPRLAPGPGCTN